MVVLQELSEGHMSSNLHRCSIHSQMLWSSATIHEILQCITNAFIIGLGNVMNSIES